MPETPRHGHRPDGGLVIDCHAHLMPLAWRLPNSPPSLYEYDELVEKQDKGGVDVSVFGNNWIRVPEGKTKPDVAKEFNEFAAEMTSRYGGRFLGLASCVPFEADSVREAERAIRELGLRGVMINSSTDGEYLDSERAEDFFTLMEELDVPVFIHPPRETIGNELMGMFRLPEMIGRPFDTTISLVRFILLGGLERHPSLKLVCAHVGGALAMLPGRLDFGYELREDASFGPWSPDVLPEPPSAYIAKLFLDTMSFHPPAVMCAVGTVGVDRVVFGSDHPPVHLPLERSVSVVTGLPLATEDKNRILGRNAERLLGLVPSP